MTTYSLQWKPPSGTFRKIPPSSYAMVVKCKRRREGVKETMSHDYEHAPLSMAVDDHGGYVYSPVVKVLQGPLPSNKLQVCQCITDIQVQRRA